MLNRQFIFIIWYLVQIFPYVLHLKAVFLLLENTKSLVSLFLS